MLASDDAAQITKLLIASMLCILNLASELTISISSLKILVIPNSFVELAVLMPNMEIKLGPMP